MNFLALVLALALQQVLAPGNALQSRRWLLACDDFLARYVTGSTPRLIVLLLALLLVAEAVLEEFGDWSFGLPALLASAAVLLWSLGSADYHTALERLAARAAGRAPQAGADDNPSPDDAGAGEIVASLWMPVGQDPADGASRARQRLLYAGFARWYPPLFYFALAGPLGALAYRALAVLTARATDDTRLRLLWLLDWLPARLLVLTFALAGDFVAVTRSLRGTDSLHAATPELLEDGAMAACGDAASARAVGDLLHRCAGLWLLVLSAAILLF
jgi:AmpE protein